jgi:hypothetical protein
MRHHVAIQRGQALTEFTLVFPLFILTLLSVVVLGLYVFYNQQLQNAAREAARYAATTSASAQCPTVSRLDPIGSNRPESYYRCDAPEQGWPKMTARARAFVWGMNPSDVHISACWSGFVDSNNNYDALPQAPNTFVECTIGKTNPRTDASSISCPPPPTFDSATSPKKADGDDKASAVAYMKTETDSQHFPTTVTVLACFNWTPPMAGFVMIPPTITLRSVITQAIQRQQ